MEISNEVIIEQLNILREKTRSDFSALACLGVDSHIIYWKHVSGNRSERYKQMQGRPGKGFAGLVVRADRLMVLDESTPDAKQKRLEYPIMLAEGLYSTMAVPLKQNNITSGVLLIGSRTLRKYSPRDIQILQDLADEMTSFNNIFLPITESLL